MLRSEYFKWLSNLTLKDLERFAKHLLNEPKENRKFSYPKVTIKVISSMLESCYNMKEWVKRRKKKQLMKQELHNIDPTLGLINAKGEFIYKTGRCSKRVTTSQALQ